MNISKENLIGIAWSNTDPNLIAWGSDKINIGDNPISIAKPHNDFVSDSHFGKVQIRASAGEELVYVGGLDKDENETKNPKDIINGGLAYPMGYWKGYRLAIP